MDYLLDILQGLGIAVAAGLSPFMPLAMAAVAGLVKLGANYDGTSFEVLGSPIVLVLAILLAVAAIVLRRRLETPQAETALLVVAMLVGAIATGATVADHSDTWWPGLILGAAAAFVGAKGSASLIRRTRERLDDEGARSTLAVGAVAGATVISILSIVLPPVGLLALVAAVVLLVRGRRRDQSKHAGLRVLR